MVMGEAGLQQIFMIVVTDPSFCQGPIAGDAPASLAPASPRSLALSRHDGLRTASGAPGARRIRGGWLGGPYHDGRRQGGRWQCRHQG